MQSSDIKYRNMTRCIAKNVPLPEFAACVKCGDEVEIWTDEDEPCCPSCGR